VSHPLLAQLNIGRLRFREGDPRLKDFYEALDRVNAVAERFPGFVWRLKDETGQMKTMPWPADAGIVPNLTVWESIETLEKFVWQTVHAPVYQRKHDWFEAQTAKPYFVMWWIDASHRPTLEEAKERLDHLEANGPSEYSFGWESAPQAKLWREKRCA
jgi:hypothetical protein